MKYWAYLIGKLAVVACVVYGLQFAATHRFPPPPAEWFGKTPTDTVARLPVLATMLYGKVPKRFQFDMAYTFAVLGVWLVGAGLIYVAILDQRRRCRTCLRRLIMPVAMGSWGNMLTIGRPKTAWICPFGHGTLTIDELQITGKETPDWEPHDDNIWKELESYYQARK
ncbi:MAG: hypothetical protein JOZ62_21780 [Acidobacteriaceae bacterium]|nr:hypothetical protein [Acidobacteriaceae bacterium]